MIHNMRLHNDPFIKIKNNTKTIEIRLNDEKRQQLKVGDTIEFTNVTNNEKILVGITDLYKFKNFTELYKKFDKISLGYNEDEIANPKDMEEYYSTIEQEKYGVLGIKIKLLKNK